MLETPQEIIKQMERMVSKFLWKGPDKVKRLSVINSLKNGDLNITDLETQIKAIGLPSTPRVSDERKVAEHVNAFHLELLVPENLSLRVVKFADTFFRKKHSLSQGTFFKSALFSATGAFITLIYDAKAQSSRIYFLNSYNVPLH
ncbi:hypothetical protein P5673_011933 [Acropora cervicornis]|uniref:Uncharacterized protein n=1 Tax=Acropora cervicornis TaxID=6130 RepID=A0AAD9QNG1_ACRCE|nr:hypothetical protein P5673_011933 [Acropora cervicornis]